MVSEIDNISFQTIPAYNLSKNYHQKISEWVGYLINIDNENVLCRFCLGGNILCLELVAFEFNKHKASIKSLQPMSLTIITALPKLKPLFVFFHFADGQTRIMSFSNSPKEKHLIRD